MTHPSSSLMTMCERSEVLMKSKLGDLRDTAT
jgi:hypothetical protein